MVKMVALALASAFLVQSASAVQQYTAVALDRLGTVSVGMNAAGDVVAYHPGQEDQLGRPLPSHVMILKPDGSVVDLGTMPGRNLSAPVAINDRGDVIGVAYNFSSGDIDARPFIHSGGTNTDLAAYMGLDGDAILLPRVLSNSGGVGADLEVHGDITPLVFVNGAVSRLPQGCGLGGMNAAGQVTGACSDHFGSNSLFVYEAGDLTLIPLDGSIGVGTINDHGEVPGFLFKNDDAATAFVYSRSEGMRDIGALGAGRYAGAVGINNRGQVVGFSTTKPPPSFASTEGHAFLYSDGQMYDLNALVVAGLGKATLRSATAINDNGQILATGCIDRTFTCQYYRLDPQPPTANYSGLWWASPAGSESGWGVNISQQGDVVFATWFTYDEDGKGMWLVMSDGRKTAPDTYTGTLYRTTGPAFNSFRWDSSRVGVVPVGTATFAFSGRDDALFSYRVGDISQSKPITRQVFALPVPDCIAGAGEGVVDNYQALWWGSPAGSESGWGLHITHQGDVLFATWFTYDSAGNAMWLVMPNMKKIQTGDPDTHDYTGPLFRTTGPPFSAHPWDPSRVTAIPVGKATIGLTGWNLGAFVPTLDGVEVGKLITRQVFSASTAGCN